MNTTQYDLMIRVLCFRWMTVWMKWKALIQRHQQHNNHILHRHDHHHHLQPKEQRDANVSFVRSTVRRGRLSHRINCAMCVCSSATTTRWCCWFTAIELVFACVIWIVFGTMQIAINNHARIPRSNRLICSFFRLLININTFCGSGSYEYWHVDTLTVHFFFSLILQLFVGAVFCLNNIVILFDLLILRCRSSTDNQTTNDTRTLLPDTARRHKTRNFATTHRIF